MYCNPRNKEMENEYIREINKYKDEVLNFEETPKRDKRAIKIISKGKILFKLSWSVYCKITSRM